MSTPLLENILNQPAALKAVGIHHLGSGREGLTAVASLLASKKRVVLSGMGASLFACIPFSYGLSAQGMSVTVIEAAELLYFLGSQVDAETAVVLVSRSGESVEVTKLLSLLHGRGAAIVGVANVRESTLIRDADLSIVIGSPTDQMVAVQTYTATLLMFALLEAIIKSEVNSAAAELDIAIDAITRWVPECVAARESWTGFLESQTPLYYLGRGASTAAVAEGVLLMHETAKFPAVGMTAAQFRHGPVEVVDRNFRAIVFGTQSVTAALDAGLADDLVDMRGEVRWVGPAVPGSKASALCAWPANLPARFSAIAETIPLQVAAYRKAELNGVQPGEFRWAPLVTASETGFLMRVAQ